MKFNFEFNPAAMTSDTIIAMIFAAIIFIVVPVILASLEYRITKKNSQLGIYLIMGIFASSLLLGLYSVLLGIIMLIVHYVATNHKKQCIN